MTFTEPSLRARFWRRAFAFVIDACVVWAVIATIGIALFEATDGRIRAENTLVNYSTCSRLNVLPAGLDLPPGFKATHAESCTHYFFGVVHNRSLAISEVTRSGAVTYTRTITFATDAEGRPTDALYLDYFWVLIFAGYRIILEWRFGATLGKRTLHMRVQPLGGGSMAAGRACKRTLICFIPTYPYVFLLLLLIALGPSKLFALGPYFFAIVFIGLALLFVFSSDFIRALRRGNLPWHDRWAGTEVVCTATVAPPRLQGPVGPTGPKVA